jgi:hypothetical protein
MSYQNDPNINRRNGLDRGRTSYTGWIMGGLVALALVIGLFTMFGRDNTNTASNTSNGSTVTTVPGPAAPTTTGSGTASTPAPAKAPAR